MPKDVPVGLNAENVLPAWRYCVLSTWCFSKSWSAFFSARLPVTSSTSSKSCLSDFLSANIFPYMWRSSNDVMFSNISSEYWETSPDDCSRCSLNSFFRFSASFCTCSTYIMRKQNMQFFSISIICFFGQVRKTNWNSRQWDQKSKLVLRSPLRDLCFTIQQGLSTSMLDISCGFPLT